MKTTFKTPPSPLPTRAQFRRNRSGCTFEEYVENTRAMRERVAAREAEMEACAAKIRAILPATEAQITWGLRYDHKANLVCSTLSHMIGSRRGAETTGELVISGYSAGAEIYDVR